MAKKAKCKLTAAEKAEKARRKAQFMSIFINGRQKRVRRPGGVEGRSVEDFMASNADPMWLHQNEMWEYLPQPASGDSDSTRADAEADDIPFQCPESGVS